MGFLQAVRSCYVKKYAEFEGRAPRSEFWFFHLFFVFVFFVLGLTMVATAAPHGMSPITMLLAAAIIFFLLASIIPSIALTVRRLHDTNASGWWILLQCIPSLGTLIVIIWGCIPGTDGTNDFGPDPFAVTRTLV